MEASKTDEAAAQAIELETLVEGEGFPGTAREEKARKPKKGKKGKGKKKAAVADDEGESEEPKPKKKGKKKTAQQPPKTEELQFGEKSKQEISEVGVEGRYVTREARSSKYIGDNTGIEEAKEETEGSPTQGKKELISELAVYDGEEKQVPEKELATEKQGEPLKEKVEDGQEVRRRATLTELRTGSVEEVGKEETTPKAADEEGLAAVKEESPQDTEKQAEGETETHPEKDKEKQAEEDAKETKVDIELERKMSRQDSLKSIKVVPTEPKEQVSIPLPEVEEGQEVTEESMDEVQAEKTGDDVVQDVALEVEAAVKSEKEGEVEAGIVSDDTKKEGDELEEVIEDKPKEKETTKEVAVELTHEGEGGDDVDGKTEETNIGDAEDDKTKPFLEYEVEDELPWAMYRSLDPPQEKLPIEEDDDWPKSDEEIDYEPPENEDLSDLDEVMGKLDGNESELETSAPPPPVIKPEEKVQQTRKIDELKLGMVEEPILEYLEEFERKMEEEIIMIGQISLEEIQEEERHLRDEHIAYQQQEAKLQRQRLEEILQRMEEAKRTLMRKLKEKRKSLQRRQEHIMQQDRLIQNRIHRAFRRAESQLLKALKARKGEVKTMYGDLILADGQYGGSKGRRWKVDWNRTPQPIQIKLKCLRGVKDKLPAGRYVLMVSLYDRLGGHVLKWSNLKGQQWGGATLPLHHDGEFYNIEIKIDQSVFTVCPARPDVRPGMILVFELFILRGTITATDRVVGWGCFPVCDGEFNIVEGKYKATMLRGDMDASIDKHEKIEELLAQDLENWLCNMYFEVVKLPRYMAGQKEYEVELQFTSGLVGYPARTNTGEEFVDGEEPIYGSRADLKSIASPSSSRRASRVSMIGGSSFLGSTMDLKTGEEKEKGSTVDLHVEVPDMAMLAKRKQSLFVPESSGLRRSSAVSQSARRMSAVSQGRRMSRPMTVHMSRKVMEAEASSEGSGTDYSDDEVLMLKKDDGFKPVKGQPGMFYKKHHNNPVDVYAKKMFTLLPKTPVLTKRRKKKKLSHLEELDQHTFSVQRPWSNKGRIHHKGREKMQYVGRQLLAELGLSQWRSREFWAMMLMIAITWWIRLYTHYGGQWLYLTALRIPINKFEFLPYTVNLNYQSTLLHTEEEIALVILGPFTVIVVFCVQIMGAWAIQALFGIFPNILSRFIMAFGLNTLLDPFWIVIVDSALKRYLNIGGVVPIGDAFKLYWHFDRYENNGAVGIVLTLFLYIVTLFTASTILYMYFLRLHNNGRLLDVYHRLHAGEDNFLVPYDLEVSNEELNFICKKAEQWRGEEGERRKTAVYDYIWEEEQVDESEMANANSKTGHREITTHVSLHTLHLDGLRELYRHFLRLPDGAIVEVFNEMGLAGMDEGVKQALIKGTSYQGMDNNAASRSSLRSRVRSPSAASINSMRRPSVMLEVPKAARAPSPV